MKDNLIEKYKTKAKDSFKTKLNLFLFSLVVDNEESFTAINFSDFRITQELVDKYSSEYWQKPKDSYLNGLLIEDIYKRMNYLKNNNGDLIVTLEREYIKTFEKLFSFEAFEKLLSQDRCHYCDISIADIEMLAEKRRLYRKNERGWILEIDRLNSNFEYTPENCVMACYWCNNAKTDEFTETEFLEIGKVIKDIWKKRLE
jgi:5-methylcytosine-specific restriction endonuclease McrA